MVLTDVVTLLQTNCARSYPNRRVADCPGIIFKNKVSL